MNEPAANEPSASTPADAQAAFAATLVDEWVRGGVTDAVVAPGSRSTPVLAALAADGRLRLHVVLDERAGGFLALGLGLATSRPAPVVTTSGTASVELHPAVVEAHQAGVPFLAVTADRPPELHHVGAPQTTEQEGLFGPVTRWAVSPGVPDLAAAGAWRSLASRTVAATLGGPHGPGPVHLNLALREPLLGDPAAVRAAVPPGRPGSAPWHLLLQPRPAPPDPAAVQLLSSFAGRRGLLIAGGGVDAPDRLVELARRLGWPLLAEPRSGARWPDPVVVGAFDALLRAEPVRSWIPEVVVRAGDPPASKVLTQWLAGLPDLVPQLLVDPSARWADPDRRAAVVVPTSAGALAGSVMASLPSRAPTPPSTWAQAWQQAETAAQQAIAAATADGAPTGWSEPAIARTVHAAVPAGSVLVASSSMPVRDLEWFSAPRRGIRVLANRGVNGIDGVVATTLGAALAGRPTVGLLGDLAFAYDASALLWAAERDVDCTFVVVDNDGGGIFSFLPQATALDPDRFERHWGTPHGLDLLALAAAYGVVVTEVATLAELRRSLQVVGSGRGVRVLRCRTDRASNVVHHATIEAAVVAALRRAGPDPEA